MKGPKGEKLDGLKERNWTVIRDESRRCKKIEGLNRCRWRKLVIKCVDDKFGMLVTSQVTNWSDIRPKVKSELGWN